MNLPHGTRAEVRDEAANLTALGFSFTGTLGNGHLGFEHPEIGRTQLPSSPSETQRWRLNFRTQIARRLGITLSELELRLGLRQPKHQGPRVRRKRNDAGRQARRFTVVREGTEPVSRVGTPAERRREIVSEREAVDNRLTELSLQMDEGDEYQSLLGERCRLIGELAQAEVDAKAVAA